VKLSHHDKSYNFQTLFAFLELKIIGTHISGHIS